MATCTDAAAGDYQIILQYSFRVEMDDCRNLSRNSSDSWGHIRIISLKKRPGGNQTLLTGGFKYGILANFIYEDRRESLDFHFLIK